MSHPRLPPTLDPPPQIPRNLPRLSPQVRPPQTRKHREIPHHHAHPSSVASRASDTGTRCYGTGVRSSCERAVGYDGDAEGVAAVRRDGDGFRGFFVEGRALWDRLDGGEGWCLFDRREGFGKDSVPQRGVGKTVAKTLGRGDEVAALPRSSHGARSRGVSSRPTGSLNDDLSRKGNGQPAPPGKTDSSHAHYPPEQTGLSKNPKTLASKTDPEKSGDTPNGFKNNSREPAVPNDQGCTPPTAKTHSVSPVNQVPVLKTDPGPAEPKTHTEAKPISTNPTASSPPIFKNEQRYKAKAILL